jgi:RNA polymerase sigma-70 factor (ECF subfamily)
MVSIRPWVVVGEIEERSTAEAALLRAVRAGDRTALEQLLALYERPLFTFCRDIVRHDEDAEDAVQETFLRALRALPGFRGEAAFRTWLYRIAVNVCLKSKAARLPIEPWDEARSSAILGRASPEAEAMRHLQVREALGILPPRQRAILLLKAREGWTVAEIAAGLGWSERRVEYELSKARNTLFDWQRRDAGQGAEP